MHGSRPRPRRRASVATDRAGDGDHPKARPAPHLVGPGVSRTWPAALAAFAIAAGVYMPSLGNPMVWDDELHVPMAVSGSAGGEAVGQYRRPAVLASYRLQAALGADSSSALHAANAGLHGANAALAVAVLRAAGLSAFGALGAATLFALHPVASGSVAYVSGRTDLLAAFFTLVAVLAAFEAGAGWPDRRGRGSRAAWAATATAAALAASASKESGLVAGVLVAGVWWWRGGPRALLGALAASAAAAAFVLPAAAAHPVPPALRLAAAGTSARTFASLLVAPADLHLDRLTPTGGLPQVLLGAAVCAALAAAILRFVARPSGLAFGAAAAAALYLPGSGLVPVYPAIVERFVFTGEQFLYLPLLPLAALAAAAAEAATTRLGGAGARIAAGTARVLPWALLATAAACWIPTVLARQEEFASAERVYRKTLAHSPSPRACYNLGSDLLRSGRLEEALDQLARCVEMAPGDAGIRGQFAVAAQKLGRLDEAGAAYAQALVLDPGQARIWSNAATLDAGRGLYSEARRKWRRALELDPREETARAALARLDAAGL